jgi:hypothetical protein
MRAVVVAILLILVALAPPLAAASDACMAMSGVCEGPCGVASCSTVVRAPDGILPVTAATITPAPDQFPSAPLRLPDLPPRPHLHLA